MIFLTLTKLAKLANVSVSTASKAFSMSNEISEETRNLVFATAKKYDCFRQFYSAKCPKMQIAVICPEMNSHCYSSMLDMFYEKLKKRNCEICFAASDFSIQKAIEQLRYFDRYSTVDAVIMFDVFIEDMPDLEIPVITIGSHDTCDIYINSNISFSKALKSLTDKGIKKIGYIGETHTNRIKEKIITLLEQNNIEYNQNYFIETSERFESGGYKAFKKLMELPELPEAVFCAYDYMAIGTIRAIYDNSLSVPDNISIIGFNNIAECEYLCPRLSSIGFDISNVCDKAISLLFAKLNKAPTEKIEIFSQFIKRDSQK